MGEDAAVVRRMFDRYAARGVDGALEVLSADAELVVGPETSAEPDVYRGRDGAQRYFAGFEGAIDDVRFTVGECEQAGPGRVIGAVTLAGRGARTEIPVEQAAFMVFTVDAGRITRISAYASLEAARVAARA